MNRKAYGKAWRLKNKERVQIYNERAYSKKKRDPAYEAKEREKKLAENYGITEKDYQMLLQSQHGGCAICAAPVATKQYDRLHVDHCHETGMIRGLLCYTCNIGIGYFKNNEKLLIKAAMYIKKNELKAVDVKKETASINTAVLLEELDQL